MADRYAKADELLKELLRLDTKHDSGRSTMVVRLKGRYVRFEDVRDLLHRSVDEALMRREP